MDKIPKLAPLPVPTIIAVGVASPKAQGQEITNTQIPIDKANSKLSPLNSQMIVAIIASVITIGTKNSTDFISDFGNRCFGTSGIIY